MNCDLMYILKCYKAFGYKFIDESVLNLVKKSKFKDFDELQQNLNICELCNLSKQRINTVFSKNKNAKIMIILKNPSDIQNKTGDLLSSKLVLEFKNELINTLNLSEDDLYFTFMVKCHSNKDIKPYDESFQRCKPYLFDEIEKLNPRLILAMGDECLSAIFEDFEMSSLETLHGYVLKYKKNFVLPMFDLDLVRLNPAKKEFFLNDIKKIKELL